MGTSQKNATIYFEVSLPNKVTFIVLITKVTELFLLVTYYSLY